MGIHFRAGNPIEAPGAAIQATRIHEAEREPSEKIVRKPPDEASHFPVKISFITDPIPAIHFTGR
jgi:hypothetical protein